MKVLAISTVLWMFALPATAFQGIANWAHCGGYLVGGYCFYMGGNNQSCDTVCTGHGGCNLTATKNYAGSGGTDANCIALLTHFGYTQSFTGDGTNAGGCEYNSTVGQTKRQVTNATTCAYSTNTIYRVCGCAN